MNDRPKLIMTNHSKARAFELGLNRREIRYLYEGSTAIYLPPSMVIRKLNKYGETQLGFRYFWSDNYLLTVKYNAKQRANILITITYKPKKTMSRLLRGE